MSKILEQIIKDLSVNDQYKKTLAATNDENLQKEIDNAVKAFLKDIAGPMDELLTMLENNEEARSQFISRFKK